MQRIDGADVVGVIPAATAVVAPGYFSEGDPGIGVPATVVTGEWLNSIQEELAAVIVMDGAALSKASYTQLRDVLIDLLALKSDPTSTAADTTRKRANLCTTTCTASGNKSANIASDSCTAAGTSAANVASSGSTNAAIANGNFATSTCIAGDTGDNVNACIASTDSRARGTNCAAVACDDLSEAKGTNCAIIAAGDTNGADASMVEGTHCAVIASDRVQTTAGGTERAGIASFNSTVGGSRAAVIASAGASCTGSESAVIACQQDAASVAPSAAGQASFVAASLGGRAIDATGKSVCLGSEDSEADAESAIVVASEGVRNSTAYSIAGGRTAAALGAGANLNMTWRVNSITGDIFSDGVVGAGAADYAEALENAAPGVIPVGALVSRQGRKVRAAKPGDRVVGVVSARPAMVGNAAPLEWSGRWQLDEFGRRIVDAVEMVKWRPLFETRVRVYDEAGAEVYDGPLAKAPPPTLPAADCDGEACAEDKAEAKIPRRRQYKVQIRDGWKGRADAAPGPIPPDAARFVVEVPREVAGYDASKPYTSRLHRPEAWTIVGLLGQVPVRVDASVQDGDDIVPGAAGVATQWNGDAVKAARKGRRGDDDGARVEVMEITQPFDAALGYGIAWCLVR